MVQIPWLIPLIPAAAFVFILFFGKRFPHRGSEISVAVMVLNLAMSVWLAVAWYAGGQTTVQVHQRWFSYGDTAVDAAVVVDGITVMMLLVVSIVSLIVQIYSVSYMRLDRRYTHFFAILTLFTAAMEWFVMSANTLQIIFGWEVMALCSFLLIGHWWEEKHNVNAAMKAFLTTRASDIGLFVGVAVLFFAAGETFDIFELNQLAADGQIADGVLLIGAIALFVAVIGKSAQFPLHTWLPDAMAGPTPMSALIHAATMVVAGVVLLARLFPVFDEAFTITAVVNDGVNLIAVIGGITIVIAGLLAFVQRDIKKVLSYSTVAQLGYMVMAIGVGGYVAAMFHLFTHAFFKALLFLGAGNISHAVHGFDLEEDMGDLRRAMPLTHAAFAIGSLGLIGVIPFAGFWSKEQITAAAGDNGYTAFMIIAIIGTLLTAGYMVRCYYLAFWGKRRGPERVVEAPRGMTYPVLALAALSVITGFLSMPIFGVDPFISFFFPEQIAAAHAGNYGVFAVELLLPLVGAGLAGAAFALKIGPRSLAKRFALFRGLYHVLSNHYYLDTIYDRVFVRGIRRSLSWLVHWVDHNVIDSFVDFVGRFSIGLGKVVVRFFDTRLIDGVVNGSGAAAEGTGGALSRVQGGRVQRYGLLMITAAAVLALGIVVFSS